MSTEQEELDELMTELEEIKLSVHEQMARLDELLRGHEVFSTIIIHTQDFIGNMKAIGDAIDLHQNSENHHSFYWGTLLVGIVAAYENLARQVILSLVNCDDLYAHAEKQFFKLSKGLLNRLGKKSISSRKLFIAAIEKATINNPSTTSEIIQTLFGIPIRSIDECAPEFGELIKIRNSFAHHGGKVGINKIDINYSAIEKIYSLIDQVAAEFLNAIQKHSNV